jgi:hypothetical protein
LAFLEGLRAQGVHLRVDGEQLLVWPRDKLTEADRDAIRTYKRAIIDTLRPLPQNVRNEKNVRTSEPTATENPAPDPDLVGVDAVVNLFRQRPKRTEECP